MTVSLSGNSRYKSQVLETLAGQFSENKKVIFHANGDFFNKTKKSSPAELLESFYQVLLLETHYYRNNASDVVVIDTSSFDYVIRLQALSLHELRGVASLLSTVKNILQHHFMFIKSPNHIIAILDQGEKHEKMVELYSSYMGSYSFLPRACKVSKITIDSEFKLESCCSLLKQMIEAML